MDSPSQEPNPAQACLILVHGTFAPKAGWTAVGSLFREAVGNELRGDVIFREPQWSGHNLHTSRKEAAEIIDREIDEIAPDQKAILVGHSHGGAAMAYLLIRRPERAAGIFGAVFLATPFIALRVSEALRELLSALAIMCGLALAAVSGIAIGALEAALDIRSTENFWISVFLILSISAPTVIIILLVRWLQRSEAAASKLKRHLDGFVDEHDTARLPHNPNYLFVRATGDEAAAFLSVFQFIGWLSSRLGRALDHLLLAVFGTARKATSGPLGQCVAVILLTLVQLWMIQCANDFLYSGMPFRPWSVPSDLYIDFILFKTPRSLDPVISGVFQVVAWLTTAAFLAYATFALVLVIRYVLCLSALRFFGIRARREALFVDFSVEPLPFGSQQIYHASWLTDVPGEFLQHSRVYSNPDALRKVSEWAAERLSKFTIT